jgi:virulence factor Mce-like protein
MIDLDDYMTERVTRSRVRLELSRAVRPALVILLCAGIALALSLYVVSQVSPNALSSTYEAKFELADASGVSPGIHEVRLKGIPVGEITDLEIEGTRAVATVEIREEFGEIYRDVQAQLRPTTALQDMFLDIVDRGTPAAGRVGEDEPVPAAQTATPVKISEVLNVFEPTERRNLRTMLDELGRGMDDGGESLRSIFVEAVPFLEMAGDIADQLATRRPKVARLVRNTAILTGELGARENELRRLVREGAGTLGTLQAGSADLDATIRQIPPTFTRIDSSLGAVRAVLDEVDGGGPALDPVADRLPRSLTSLRDVGRDATPAVRALQQPVQRLVPFARSLVPVTDGVDVAVTTLLPQVPTVDKVTRGTAGCKSGIQGFFQWNASMSKFGDARGPIPRGNVVVGAQSSGVLGDPGEYAPQACTPGRVVGGRVPTKEDER